MASGSFFDRGNEEGDDGGCSRFAPRTRIERLAAPFVRVLAASGVQSVGHRPSPQRAGNPRSTRAIAAGH